MDQKIVCKDGKCIDIAEDDFLDCNKRYENIVDVIECMLEKEVGIR